MVVGLHRRAVGVFSHRREAENALHELRNSGFAMDRVSVIAQDIDGNDNIAGAEVHDKVGNKADEGASLGALSGGTLGGLTGLLVGLGTLAIPGVGPIMLAGATATAIATTLAGAGIGAAAGSLLGGLVGLGIPEEEARGYNSRVERGHYLVIVDGTASEIATAEAIMRRHGIEDFQVYDQPGREYDTASVVAAPVVAPYDASAVHPAAVVAPVYNSNVRSSNPLHRNRRIIGVFEHRRDAEAALTELRAAGFSMDEVSIIGKDAGGNVNTSVGGATGTDLRGNKADDGAKAGAATGAALGGLGGLLVGLGALAIPGVGPVLLGGAAATALATAATGAGIGAAAGGITGGLVGLGIPENKARVYNDKLNRGDYIVMVDATDDEVRRAEAILRRHNIQDYDVFDATDVSASRRERPAMDTNRVGYANTNSLSRGRRIIGVFEHRRDAEAALTELRDAGFSMDEVSIIGKDAGGNVNTSVGGATGTDLRGNKADDGAKAGAATGAALGGLGGLLVGLGALAIPGVGPVLLGGAAATALATAATGAGIGAAAGGITGGLVGLGIPENKARVYNDKLNRGDYIVMVDATDDEVRRAEAILRRHNIQDYDVFDATDVSASRRERPAMDTNRAGYTTDIPTTTGTINSDADVIIIDRRDETI
ncbi:multi-sensor signal transduction histidine kinase [Calothrix sp. NIES-4071]|nr:multi-sensor signal transduction histidine kinase [Calothrix sp. NIES-4071]BAZ61844.1 multi-sensor signal transduction histidine kinase [Calothrix sp. NIES-4105]